MHIPRTQSWPYETLSEAHHRHPVLDLLVGVFATLVCTAFAWMTRFWGDLAFRIMLYMACTVFVALRFGRLAWIFSALLSMLAYDYYFDIPRFSLWVGNWPNLVVFASMLAIAQVVSGLVHRLRVQTQLAQAQAKEASTLYAMSKELTRERTPEGISQAASAFLRREFSLPVDVILGGDREGQDESTCMPLQGTQEVMGYIHFAPEKVGEAWFPLLQACATPIAQALERAKLSLEMDRARVEAEAERSRSAFLSGVSHDLRTPLSAISAASTLLSQDGECMTSVERHELAVLIADETSRLDHLVENILEITRLDRSDTEISQEWQPLEGVVGSTLTHLEARMGPVPVRVDLPHNLPLVNIDGALLEQLLVNLLENALRYAAGSEIVLAAEIKAEAVWVEVRDGGPGIPESLRERIFQKFYRAPGSRNDGGIGLGLAICRAIIRAHKGRLWVEESPGGGAAFRFTLPLEHSPSIFTDRIPS